MALVQVLWGMSLLSLLATVLLSLSTTSYSAAQNAFERAKAKAISEAALHRAILGLLDRRSESRWRVDGVATRFNFDATDIDIVIQDELGRIDLNRAEGATIARLLQSAGMNAFSAGKLTDKILDWRDVAPARRLNGAKGRDYEVAGLIQRPRNGPFQTVSELLLVMDMTPELFHQIEPALTVYSGRPFIDPQTAPAEALLALPMMTPQTVAATLAARKNDQAGRLPTSMPLDGRAFTIRSEIRTPKSTRRKEVTVRIDDDPIRPFSIMQTIER